MKIASAMLVPWSSVVGSSVSLLDEDGRQIGQLAVVGVGSREAAEAIGNHVVDAIDELNRHRAVTANIGLLSTSNKK